MEQYPETEWADMTETVDGPWQLRVTDPGFLSGQQCRILCTGIIMYYRGSRSSGSAYNPEESSGYNDAGDH